MSAMPNAFPASRLKIARARRHLDELRGEIAAYFDRKGIVLRNEIDTSVKPHMLHAWVVRIREPAPYELPAIVGDVIHNLRAALDLLVCDVLRRVDPAAKLKGVSFPFSRADNNLDKVIKESGLRRAGSEAARLRKALRPYKGGNTALRAIHDLDIQDKHTGLLLVAQGGTSPSAKVQFYPNSDITPVPEIQSKARDGRRWTLDDPQAVIDAFRDNKADLPFDFDHASALKAPKGEASPASGWIKEVALRAGALCARVDWTPAGLTALATKAYRYVSPAFRHDDAGRITSLHSAGLVNRPALDLPALAHQGAPASPSFASPDPKSASDFSGARAQPGAPMAMSAALAAALGLATTASDDQAVQAVGDLRRPPSLAAFVPQQDYDLAVAQRDEAKGALATAQRADHDKAVTGFGDLVAAMAKDAGLSPSCDPTLAGIKIVHEPQTEESDMHMLTRLARRFDAVAKPGNGKLLVVPRGGGTDGAGAAMDSLTVTPNDLTKFHFGGGDRPKHGVVTADHYDPDKAKRVPKTAGGGSDPEYHHHHLYPDADHAQHAADAASKQLKRKEQRMTGETWGRPWMHAGSAFTTEGFGDDDDRNWTMVTVEHIFGGKSGLSTHFEGEPKD